VKKILLIYIIFFHRIILSAQTPVATASSFNPIIKFKGLLHSRYEYSMTDSVDVLGKYSADPLKSNFRLRRAEIRSDIKLNDHWSGVIRLGLTELKTTGTSFGRVIELAYFEYKYRDEFYIRGGQFKEPLELDELTSPEDLRMIDRGSTSRMFVNNYWASYQPGLMVFGTFMKEKRALNYYAGVFNGSDRSISYDNNSGKNYVGRLEFYPAKGFRLAVNGELGSIEKNVTGNAVGGDLSIIKNLGDNIHYILEGEYLTGTNLLNYVASTDSIKDVNNFQMTGYFGQGLLRFDVNNSWLKTFEIGGKYEVADPLSTDDENDFRTITGGIGFIFLPDNDARLQLNVVHTNYQKEIEALQKNNNMLIAQLQLKI
jgi:hypothetical protein